MIDEAKIGGITPAMFSFSGRCDDWPRIHLVADLAPRIVHEDLALAAFDEHHEVGDQHHDRDDEQRDDRIHRTGRSPATARPPMALGEAGRDTREDQDRDAVARGRAR